VAGAQGFVKQLRLRAFADPRRTKQDESVRPLTRRLPRLALGKTFALEPGRSIDLHVWTPRASLIWKSVNTRLQHSGFLNATTIHFIKRVGVRLESPHFLLSKNCFARSLPYAIMLQMKLGLRSSFEE